MIIPMDRLWLFMLVLLRVSGVFALAPFFSSPMISARIKTAFVVVFSILLASSMPSRGNFPDATDMIAPAAMEFGSGVLIGLGFHMTLAAFTAAGEVIGLQMGLGAASLFDANSGVDGALMSNFLAFTFTIVFLTLDGHHHVLRALAYSYTLPGSVTSMDAAIQMLILQAGEMLSMGCRMAAPIVIPIFLLTVSTALISRAFPQANVISLSYGLSMLVGFVLLALTIPGLSEAVKSLTNSSDRAVMRMLNGLLGA
jgi:flagellar biosynthetic protein FliR